MVVNHDFGRVRILQKVLERAEADGFVQWVTPKFPMDAIYVMSRLDPPNLLPPPPQPIKVRLNSSKYRPIDWFRWVFIIMAYASSLSVLFYNSLTVWLPSVWPRRYCFRGSIQSDTIDRPYRSIASGAIDVSFYLSWSVP